jgi:drug/metabolite transporter (DMT)-like permease
MPILGELISLGTALCWTITVISFEYAGKKVGSLPVNIIRLVFGFIFLGFTLLVLRGSFIPIDASSSAWMWLMLSGFVGLVIGDLFLFQAFVEVGGRISLLVMSLVPPLSAVLSFLIFKELISPLDLLGMFITITSIIVVVISKREKKKPFHPNVKKGVTFALIGAAAQSVGLILSKEGMGDFNAFAATQIRIIAAIIGFTIFIFFKKDWKNVGKAFTHPKAIAFITLGSFFGPFLGVSSSLLAIQYTSIGVATTIAQLNIIMIIPFSIILFKEKVSMIEVIGSITAFVGVTLMFI